LLVHVVERRADTMTTAPMQTSILDIDLLLFEATSRSPPCDTCSGWPAASSLFLLAVAMKVLAATCDDFAAGLLSPLDP
jgi:hypothetical protein